MISLPVVPGGCQEGVEGCMSSCVPFPLTIAAWSTPSTSNVAFLHGEAHDWRPHLPWRVSVPRRGSRRRPAEGVQAGDDQHGRKLKKVESRQLGSRGRRLCKRRRFDCGVRGADSYRVPYDLC